MAINSKTVLLSVLENINEAVIGVDPDLLIQFSNAASEKLFKYNSRELIGKKVDQLLEKYDAPQSSSQYETNCTDADNNKIPVSLSVKKIYSHKLLGYIYILKDMTEIKNFTRTLEEKALEIEQKNKDITKLRQELEKNEASTKEIVGQRAQDFEEEHARFLASINNLSLGFLMTDKYKNILLYNEAACHLLPSLKIKSKTINELRQSEQIYYKLDDEIDKSIHENKILNITDIQINSKYVNIFISPVILEKKTESECLGAVIIIENKTQQHMLEESKNDLFSIASHELRTPLTAIFGYTSLIKQIYFNDLQDEELKNIINNIGILSKKLSLNINNFLDSQKLEQDKIELRKDQCDLYTIINEAIKETERYSLEKNLYTKFDFPSYPITVLGDQKRLIQVMTILINNATKFTDIGGISIVAKTQLNLAKISISDTGSGIPEENKILLFNKLQQAEENLLTRKEGTGLGLHIAKLLIEKMGGTIRLDKTELNKGSTFSFMIPMITK